MTLYGKIFTLCLSTLLLSSCGMRDNERILDYRAADARFKITFPSVYGDVVCDGVRNGECTSLTVCEPQRSKGITVSTKEQECRCTVSVGDTEISLSQEAAKSLTDVINTLYAPLTEPVDASRTADGTNTVVTTPTGVLYLDEALLPCAVECHTRNGEVRMVRIEDYTVLE